MVENPGRDLQGVGGGVESPQGIDTPGMKEMPQGDETSRVTLKGDGVMGARRQGRGGNRNSPVTRDTKGTTATRRGEDITSEQEPVAPPIATQGTAEGDSDWYIQVRTQRNSDGYDGARTKHGAFRAFHEYGLLAPGGVGGRPSLLGALGIRDDPKETTGTGDTKNRDSDRRTEQAAHAPPTRPSRGIGGGTP